MTYNAYGEAVPSQIISNIYRTYAVPMGAPKTARRRWMNVPIQAGLRDRAQRLVDSPQNPGYNSVADLTNEALRRRLDELDLQGRAGALSDKLDALKPDTDRGAAKIRAAFCHKCGAPLAAGAIFCSNCRTKVA